MTSGEVRQDLTLRLQAYVERHGLTQKQIVAMLAGWMDLPDLTMLVEHEEEEERAAVQEIMTGE